VNIELPKPDWSTADGRVQLYNRDCMEVLPGLGGVDAVLTDPPYGYSHKSNWAGKFKGDEIACDSDLAARDAVIAWANLHAIPWLAFGSWKNAAPVGAKTAIVWDKGPASGMGDLSLPWKCSWELIWIGGRGWHGRRDVGVLTGHWVVTWSGLSGQRTHPNEKPLSLMLDLVAKAPAGVVLDPFAGSGTTGVACARLGRKFIGCEIEPRYFKAAVKRIEAELNRAPLFDPAPIIQRSLINE